MQNCFALIVGVNKYESLQTLRSPFYDAESITARLKTSGGDRWNVTQIPSKDSDMVKSPDLKKAIQRIFPHKDDTKQPHQLGLFFFSGHGVRVKVKDGYEAYLATTSYTNDKPMGIALRELQEILLNSGVKQQVIWLDCCHAGEFFNFLTEEEWRSWLDGGDRFVVAASRDDLSAYGSAGPKSHSQLTKVLLQALDPANTSQGITITSWMISEHIQASVNASNDSYLKKQIPIPKCTEKIEFWQGISTKAVTNSRRPTSTQTPVTFGSSESGDAEIWTKLECPNNLNFRGIKREDFVGRDGDLQELHKLLQFQQKPSLPIALIFGMPGVGKSELGLQYGKLYLDTYTGGVGWFTAVDFAEGLRDFMQANFCENKDLRYLNKLEAQVAEGWEGWQEFCGTERSALIIIDDVTDYRTQIAPYLPKNLADRHSFNFVMTSRSQLRGNQGDLAALEIRELKLEAAMVMLTSFAGENQSCITENQLEAERLCQRLGCLPLALALTGSWLSITDRTLSMLIDALEQEKLSSHVLETDPQDMRAIAERGLVAAFKVSWQDLTIEAQQLGRVLSLFEPIDLPWELVEQVVANYPKQAAIPPRRNWWQRLWDFWMYSILHRPRPLPQPHAPIFHPTEARIRLVTISLLQRIEQGKVYRLHSLLHEFFSKQWEGADRAGWMEALVSGMSDRAAKIPAFEPWEKLQWQPLRPHFSATVKVSEELIESTTKPELAKIYNRQKSALNAACFRLEQAPLFEETYRRAKDNHTKAKGKLAEGNINAAQVLFGKVIEGYESAIAQARVALPKHSMLLAGYLSDISELFRQLGLYQKGIPPAEEAMEIAKLKASPLKFAPYVNNLAILYDLQGRYSEAEPLYLRLLQISEQQLGANHPNTASSLNNLANLYDSQGRYSEAEPLLQRSLQIYEQQLGADHPDTASSLNNLAGLYDSQGRYSEAEPLLQRSLQIYEQQLGADHPDTALGLAGLATLYYSQGRYSEAEPLLQRSLSIREQQLGADHPDTASSLNNLAALYRSQGRYSEAEPLYLRSLSIREQRLGADHPSTALGLNNLAALYRSQGRYSEAEPLLQRSLSIREQQLGADHPDTASSLNNLANLYDSQGRYSEAEPLLQRSLSIREQQLGANHPNTASSLNNLANLYDSQGRYSEAEPLLQRSLSIREQQLGADHPDTASSLNNLAALYKSQGRYSEAEPLYLRSLEIDKRIYGEDHSEVATDLNNLAGLYESQGRYSEAEPLLQRSLSIREQQLGANHPDTASSFNNLAGLYASQSRYSEAEPLYLRSLQIYEQQLGANHPDTATSLNNLAELYKSQGRYSEAEILLMQENIHES